MLERKQLFGVIFLLNGVGVPDQIFLQESFSKGPTYSINGSKAWSQEERKRKVCDYNGPLWPNDGQTQNRP